MAARPSASILVGPVPFKDLVGDDDNAAAPPDEYGDLVSALPASTTLGLRQYRGAWVNEWRVPGVISKQRGFAPRPGDVLLCSPPKCGTTWLKALSFAVMARDAHPPAGAAHPLRRLNPHDCVPFMDELFSTGQQAKLDLLPSPRLMNTHMHHSLLPASVAGDNPGCKIVYVCREPKDMVVSTWHFLREVRPLTFADLFERACEGKTPNGPVWDHVLGYWSASRAAPERVLFLRYEEMLADPAGHVRELARFLGRPFSAADEAAGMPARVVELCGFEALRGVSARSSGSCSGARLQFSHQSYFRKGAVGDWTNHMTADMVRRFDAIVEDKLHGSDLAFNSSMFFFSRNGQEHCLFI